MSIKGVFSKRLILVLVDSISFFLSLYIALALRRPDIFSLDYFVSHIPRFFLIYIVFIAGMYIAGFYNFFNLEVKSNKVKFIFYICISLVFIGGLYFYLFPSNFSPKAVLLMQVTILFILQAIWIAVQGYFFRSNYKNKAVILDTSVKGLRIKRDIIEADYPISFVESLHLNIYDYDKYSPSNFLDIVKSSKVKLIISNLNEEKVVGMLPYLYELSRMGVRLIDINNFYEYLYKKISLDSVSYNWFFKEVKFNTRLYEIVKRFIDLILCLPVFIFWVLIHPWASYMIKKEDGREVYSIQERIGKYNKKIFIKKYRTMTFTDKGAWQEGSVNKITNIGSFLRKTRIDELPQILAVLNGDLSFIGPRTDIINLGDKLESEIPFYNIRYNVTPGLSGWAQVNMTYQPRSVADSKERLEYDLYYVKNRSIFLDFVIMLKTIKTVLSREGS